MTSEGDEVRLLAAWSEVGYVDPAAQAIRAEPEAVDSDTQARLTGEARRRDREAPIRARRTADRLDREVAGGA